MSVGAVILEQLGGVPRLRMMVGARDFAEFSTGAMFRFPRSRGISKCIVELNLMDTYDVSFVNGAGTVKARADGVYADNLREVFERATGLYLTL